MRPQVLILSGLYDFSTDRVALRLQEMGVSFLRLNWEHLAEWRITMDPVAQHIGVHGPGGSAEIGPELRSIFFRQPVFFRNTPAKPLTPAEQLARSQWIAFLRSLSIFDSVAWMNFPQATYLAESKPYQLLSAARCGFRVPRTLVGNDGAAIQRVFPGPLIVKALDTVLLREGDDSLFTYSSIVTGDALNDESVHEVPLLAQELVEDKTDLRLTVVGEKIFAVEILTNEKGIAGDWRVIPRDQLTYRPWTIPDEVREAVLALFRRLNLAFGGVDLVADSEGVFFIEVNPTGEWDWIASEERPIDSAIANWLTYPPKTARRK